MRLTENGLLLAVALGAPGAMAHHGPVTNPALYLTDEMVELRGELTEVLWYNPHARAHLAVVDDDGQETIWEVEMGPPLASLERRGLTPEDFLGDVRIAGFVSRRGSNELGALHVLMPSGEEFVQGNRAPLWANELVPTGPRDDILDPALVAEARRTEDGIFRTWGRGQGTDIEPQLEGHEYTARGRELNAAYDAVVHDTELLECRQGMPNAMFDPVTMQITDEGDHITIHIAEYNTRRTIHKEGTAGAAEPVASATGHSTGRWDGDDLIITTTHIDWPYYSELGTPQSDQASYVERLSVTEGGEGLNYSITITDPVVFTGPVTLESFRPWTPGAQLPPYNCVLDWGDAAD